MVLKCFGKIRVCVTLKSFTAKIIIRKYIFIIFPYTYVFINSFFCILYNMPSSFIQRGLLLYKEKSFSSGNNNNWTISGYKVCNFTKRNNYPMVYRIMKNNCVNLKHYNDFQKKFISLKI